MISISATLFNPTEKLKVQLSVGLNNNEYNNLFRVYETQKATYIDITPNIVIAMKYSAPNKPWDKTHTVYINERTISTLNQGLSNFYKKLMREDLFIYNTKGYVAELNSSNNDYEPITLTKGQALLLEPAIIYDKQGNSLPGVLMHVNMKSNEVDLSIDEFEALIDMFSKIRIRQEGMILLQTYLLLKKDYNSSFTATPQQKTPPPSPPIRGRSIFDRAGDKEFIKSPVKSDFKDCMNIPEIS